MKPGTAAASSFSTIAADLKKIDGDMDAKLFADVQALPSGFITDKEKISDACTTAQAVGEIAARQKRYELLSLMLKTAPQNGTQVAQAIAAGAGKFEPLTHRKVPLTTFQKDDEKFLPDYHPDAAKEYISGWKAVGIQLADAKTKPRAAVLNAVELSVAYDATTKPIADYLRSYTNYWTDDLHESLKVSEFPSWSGIFTNDLKTGQWEVKALVTVWGIDEASRKALNAVLTPQMVQSLNLPPAMTEREYGVLQERTIKCVSRWRCQYFSLKRTAPITIKRLVWFLWLGHDPGLPMSLETSRSPTPPRRREDCPARNHLAAGPARCQQDRDQRFHRSLLQKANATRTPMVNSRAPSVAAVFVSMGRHSRDSARRRVCAQGRANVERTLLALSVTEPSLIDFAVTNPSSTVFPGAYFRYHQHQPSLTSV